MSDLRPLYRSMAEQGENFHGLSIVQHKDGIKVLIQKHKAFSLLDYGCGRGDAYWIPHTLHRGWGVPRPYLYDPSFEGHDHPPLPGHQFDGVLCSDVLEHIPEDDVDEFVRTLFGYAKKFVWASVCCRAAKKTFPDGTNLHVTIKPPIWWAKKFRDNAGGVDWVLTETV
jgi:hypothetical protein